MDLPHKETDSVYIITEDLGERVESLRLLGIKTPDADDTFFADFHAELKQRIGDSLPGVKVVSYNMKQLAEQIWKEALRLQDKLKNSIVISSCPDLASPRRGHTIEINRIVDQDGNIIGLGPRPGSPSLQEQLRGISHVANGNPIVLIEDGAFSGSTIEHLQRELSKIGASIKAIVIGICFPSALENLRINFDGEIIIVEETPHPYEWMPDHDFIPFAPNCGRIFGAKFGHDVLPHYTHEGFSYCLPYVLPFGDPTGWASIPKDQAVVFSAFCLRKSIALFEMLDKLNDRMIKMRDVIGATPRISVPMTKGSSQLPNVDFFVSSFLKECLEEF